MLVKYGSIGVAEFLNAPDPIFGSGSDGSVVFDGTSTVLGITPASSTYSLNRDIYCYNMTVADSVKIRPNGFRIFVQNLLSLGNASVIGWDALEGFSSGGTLSAGSTGIGTGLGGNGIWNNTLRTTSATSTWIGGPKVWDQPHNVIFGLSVMSGSQQALSGGSGGSNAPGGGLIVISARYISCSATTTNAMIRADGQAVVTAQGASNAGGGGVIVIISSASALPTNVSTSVSGGGSGGGVSATAGTVKYISYPDSYFSSNLTTPIRKYGTSITAGFSDSPHLAYGNGSDGSVTLDGTTTILGMVPASNIYTMTRNLFCENLTINSNVSLNPGGFLIRVRNTLTLNSGSVIGWPTATSSISNDSMIFFGTTNSSAISIGGGGYNSNQEAGPDLRKQAFLYYTGLVRNRFYMNQALMGGYGASNAGGGVILLCARYIEYAGSSGTATLRAEGAASTGGGAITTISSAPALPSSITTSVSGSPAGTTYHIQLV